MILTDATWEKRNLGVSGQELTIEHTDNLNEVMEQLHALEAGYQVIKVPAGMTDIMFGLEEQGFHFIETSIHVLHNLAIDNMNSILKRMNDSISYERMNQEDLKEMYEKIDQGMFYTDRVFLDEKLRDRAAYRYKCWLNDEIQKGTEIFKYIYKDKVIGFFSFKEIEDGVYYPFLAGIYKDFQHLPFGMVYVYKPIIEAKKRNGKMISTYISTNNPNAMRMHVDAGFTIKEVTYVYIKHAG